MTSILFVDDEIRVLNGLRRMLRSMRSQWSMEFSADPVEAMGLLKGRQFDVVVSDMRMPGMDGAALLEKVRQHDPGVGRIVLSGQTDRESAVKASGTAHQFLTKPCQAEQLKAAIERACSIRALLTNEHIRSAVSGVRALPSLPQVYAELTEAMLNEETSLQTVADIVRQDLALTAKILQVVNSAYFGLSCPVENIVKAVSYLGIDIVRSLTLSTAVFEWYEGEFDAVGLEKLHEHSLDVGAVAAAIAQAESAAADVIDAAWQAGMLHDVGKLVLSASLACEYAEVFEESAYSANSLHAIERERFGCDHADIGGYLLGLWGLPLTIVEAVTGHHLPASCVENEPLSAAAVRAANQLVKERILTMDVEDDESVEDSNLELYVPGQKVRAWLKVAQDTMRERLT